MKRIWYFKGDCHGTFDDFENLPKEENQSVIILGDSGVNYYGGSRDQLSKQNLLSRGDYNVYCLRGNHDINPMKITPKTYVELDVDVAGPVLIDYDYPRIRYLIDGVSYKINGHTLLPIGGDSSEDKEYRIKKGWNWFQDEVLSEQIRQNIYEIQKDNYFDIVITHTCPYKWEKDIEYLFLKQVSQDKIDKTMEKYLDTIE